MNKATVAIVLALILIPSAVSIYIILSVKPGKVMNITIGKGFDTIQEAVDASETLDGHTIVVPSGVFRENVVLTKSLVLKGESKDSSIVEIGDRSTIVIRVNASYCTVANLTVRGGFFGIWVFHHDWARILGNHVINCTTAGIRIDNSRNSVVDHNIVSNGTLRGIHVYSGSFNTTVSGNIVGNVTGEEGIGGVWIYGAVDVESSDKTLLIDNSLSNSASGLHLYYDAINTTIYHNNFVDNVRQVIFHAFPVAAWDAGYPSGGNYWSDYAGTDANGDGIGDTPYTIDSNNQDRYPLMTPHS